MGSNNDPRILFHQLWSQLNQGKTKRGAPSHRPPPTSHRQIKKGSINHISQDQM